MVERQKTVFMCKHKKPGLPEALVLWNSSPNPLISLLHFSLKSKLRRPVNRTNRFVVHGLISVPGNTNQRMELQRKNLKSLGCTDLVAVAFQVGGSVNCLCAEQPTAAPAALNKVGFGVSSLTHGFHLSCIHLKLAERKQGD